MNYIGTKLTDFLNRGYSNLEWTGIKWSLVPLMMIILCYAIPDFRGAIIHENICSYIDCSYAIKLPYVGLAIAGGLGLMYLFEVAMLVCLPLLAVVSFYLFSYLEAVGLKGEYGLFSLTFLSQFIAYVRHKRNPATDLATERVHFPLQLIAAAYVLSAISKLWVSGLGWFNENAVNFAVQIYREYSSSYASSGQIAFEGLARDYSSFILQNVWLIKLLLGFCVLIEACAFIDRKSVV